MRTPALLLAACSALAAGVPPAVAQSVAHGGRHVPAPYCPPPAFPGFNPVVPEVPAQPAKPEPTKPDASKPDGTKPDGTKPDGTKPDTNTNTNNTDNQNNNTNNQNNTDNQNNQNNNDANSQSDFASAGATGGEGGGASGGTQIGGRIDAFGRFNLFDNMSAIPQTRVWVTYMYASQFETGYDNVLVRTNALLPGVRLDPSTQAFRQVTNGTGTVTAPTFVTPQSLLPNAVNSGTTALANDRGLSVTRLGFEYAFTKNLSFAGQAVYLSSGGTDVNADAWGQPQLMLKYAAINRPDTVLTGTIAVAPQVSTGDFEIHEATTRVLPGFLFYQTLSDIFIVQGGAQFGLALTKAPDTADVALSLGQWFYRDPNLDPSGRQRPGAPLPCFFRGALGQFEVFGKQVIGGNTDRPNNLAGALQNFREPQSVIDVSFNGRLLLGRANLNLGVGLPITGSRVRGVEVLSGVNLSY